MDRREEDRDHDIVDDATQLGLAVVAEATALQSGDERNIEAAEDNLRDTVDGLIDEPLTERQGDVVETLAASSAAIAAGLAGSLAADQDRPVGEVLEGAARSIVMGRRSADQGENEHRRSDREDS
jgi:hypothetical protein